MSHTRTHLRAAFTRAGVTGNANTTFFTEDLSNTDHYPNPRVQKGRLVVDHVAIEHWIARENIVFRAIKDVKFAVPSGGFTAIIGPSGCGKSTLLRAIAGLVPYSHGMIQISGKQVTHPGFECSMVFQSPCLLPWRSVLKNVAYGLEARRLPKSEIERRSMEMVRLVGLAEFGNRYPHELSGGMQQRVNLARALAVDPDIVLLDEPFASLDHQTRQTMGQELLRIWEHTHKTVLLVTHQIDEAVSLADQVVVMSAGPESTVLDVVDIEIARPRDREVQRDPAFIKLVDHIWDVVKDAWFVDRAQGPIRHSQ